MMLFRFHCCRFAPGGNHFCSLSVNFYILIGSYAYIIFLICSTVFDFRLCDTVFLNRYCFCLWKILFRCILNLVTASLLGLLFPFYGKSLFLSALWRQFGILWINTKSTVLVPLYLLPFSVIFTVYFPTFFLPFV